MKCAYCGKEAKGTKEHIISCSVLDLFPECYATIDNIRGVVHGQDPMVKDVCAECNNHKISYIDSYAKSFVQKYFLEKFEKDDELDFGYNYTLMQKVLLKYAFNDLRSHKDDTSFFFEDIINFLLDEERTEPLNNIIIMAGLAVNTSPAPDYIFGNVKIRWGKNPRLLSNSIIEYLDYNTGQIIMRKDNEEEHFEGMIFSYVFRFNSAQFLMICWDKDIAPDILRKNKMVLGVQYPYTILDQNGKSILTRCTSETTYHFENLVDVSWGQDILDEISYMRGTFNEQSQNYLRKVETEWKVEEDKLAQQHSRNKV